MASEFWETVIALRDNLLNLNTIQTVQGLSPVPSCLWRKGLSTLQGSSHPEWEDALAQFINLKIQKNPLKQSENWNPI